MLTQVLIAIAAIAVVFVIVVALQPSMFRVTRSKMVAASSAVVFARVNDLHGWEAWSPWAKLDPAMKQTYEGAPLGTGATYKWDGNSKVGEGRMTIIESRPNDLIRIELQFIRPFACTNAVEFTFKPEGSQTEVTWSMSGKNNFVAKAVGLFMNMDRMVGGQFDQGLSQLKALIEAPASG